MFSIGDILLAFSCNVQQVSKSSKGVSSKHSTTPLKLLLANVLVELLI